MTLARAKVRSAVCLALLALAAFSGQATVAASPASADECAFGQCVYGEGNHSPGVKRWFSAATTLRNWTGTWVIDAYGGSVNKCAGFKRSSDSAVITIGCGNVTWAGGEVPAAWRPGWVYFENIAAGVRQMHGVAQCPGC